MSSNCLVSRRNWLRLCPALVITHGVGCRDQGAAQDSKTLHSETLEHTFFGETEKVQDAVNALLAKVYAIPLPHCFPNWIASHSLLMHGESAYPTFIRGEADENLQKVFAAILKSNTQSLGPYVLRSGLPYPRHKGPYFSQEHHPGQFLNYFSMGGGKAKAVIEIDESRYKVEDLLRRSLLETRTVGELAYLVLAYSYFLEPNAKWKNKFGEPMSLARLLEVLLKIPETTCLGTHRLAALARTFSRPEHRQDPRMNKLWPELERQVNEALLSLKQNQLGDGSFSVPGVTPGNTSPGYQNIFFLGHSLEWIMFLEKEYARDDWITRAVQSLVEGVSITFRMTYRNLDAIGDEASYFDFDGLTHAVSALRRWRDKVQEE